MTVHLLLDPERSRPLTYTAGTDPDMTFARYAEPEGHHGRDAHRRGRELAYRRGLAIVAVEVDALLAAATSVVAVHVPAE